MNRILSWLLIALLGLAPVVQASHVCCLQSTDSIALAASSSASEAEMTMPCHGPEKTAQHSEVQDADGDAHQCVHNGACCFGMAAAVGPLAVVYPPLSLKPEWLDIQLRDYPKIFQRLDRPPSFA